MDAIRTDALTKYYGKARGIEQVSLTVREGEFFGFIGPNGAGKSTTIRTLLGLIYPTSGHAEVCGHAVSKDMRSILAQVGYLPSEISFYAGMRVREVLRLSAGLRNKDCGEAARRLCERLRLDPGCKVDELSYGNRKKVGIVCALQHAPRLLILDEPTSGLDPLMQKEFFSILQEHNQNGAAVFLSSHILSEIQRYCTRAAIIREGRVIACDEVSRLARTSARRVALRGTVNLDGLTGIRDRREEGDSVSFLYNGDMAELLKALAGGRVTDLSVSEPALEEIFLHYYEKEGETA